MNPCDILRLLILPRLKVESCNCRFDDPLKKSTVYIAAIVLFIILRHGPFLLCDFFFSSRQRLLTEKSPRCRRTNGTGSHEFPTSRGDQSGGRSFLLALSCQWPDALLDQTNFKSTSRPELG
ncbi:hypothetical protein BJX61DRAFT_92708 [Aspergillus egyptiacus]|nr:hypothetical protein BJX61DRAFT_92708 [Aspergillus egyptiacus]